MDMPAGDDEDVPPLEDCSEMIAQVNKMRDARAPPPLPPPQPLKEDPKVTVAAPTSNANNDPQPKKFGGMKKGFLFGDPKPKTSTSTTTSSSKTSASRDDSLPMVKAKQTKEEALRLDEVQTAMTESLGSNKEWLTEDLLSKVAQNEQLLRWLSDPRMSHVLEEFQKNPSAAQRKYADNAEISDFFKQFAGLMGEHFSQLANKQDQLQQQQLQKQQEQPQAAIRPAVDGQVDRALANSEVRAALMDPDVQKAIDAMRTQPELGERIMRTADSKLRHNLSILVKAGVLGVQ